MKKIHTLFMLLFCFTAIAQVGVNNSTPDQALDVNGKIKLSDDATTPTAGTMRYNNTDSAFEGHDGTQWNSFNSKKTSALPSNPVPIYGYSPNISRNEGLSLSFRTWTSSSSFKTPPAGKLLIITGIYPRDYTSAVGNGQIKISMGISPSENGGTYSETQVLLSFKMDATIPYLGDSAPIFVLKPGEYLNAYNYTTSATELIKVNVRGFLVDDLNY
ncbi:hypothetical protein [Algibacter pacificus]|uniref:hypothetical protein n=1 Tax=Algibacter pacificus TaxID=2599389 RepID=UPI0011CC6FEB|nr:hypothetical protein [Algibacter pacificus]